MVLFLYPSIRGANLFIWEVWKLELAVIVTVIGLILTLLNILDRIYANKKRIKDEGKQEQITSSDIEVLRQGNANISIQLDKMDSKMDNYQERLIRVEESAKSAHKRIDSLEVRHGS